MRKLVSFALVIAFVFVLFSYNRLTFFKYSDDLDVNPLDAYQFKAGEKLDIYNISSICVSGSEASSYLCFSNKFIFWYNGYYFIVEVMEDNYDRFIDYIQSYTSNNFAYIPFPFYLCRVGTLVSNSTLGGGRPEFLKRQISSNFAWLNYSSLGYELVWFYYEGDYFPETNAGVILGGFYDFSQFVPWIDIFPMEYVLTGTSFDTMSFSSNFTLFDTSALNLGSRFASINARIDLLGDLPEMPVRDESYTDAGFVGNWFVWIGEEISYVLNVLKIVLGEVF